MPSSMSLRAVSILATLGVAAALRPNGTTICDYYTPIILGKENSPASQHELMALITHTFILGNFTTPNVGVKVDGIAGPMKYQNHDINLLPYVSCPCCRKVVRFWRPCSFVAPSKAQANSDPQFTGGYASTNRGGKPTVVNFLDDGGATALLAKKPSNTTTSNQ